jgi:hypothetical protein
MDPGQALCVDCPLSHGERFPPVTYRLLPVCVTQVGWQERPLLPIELEVGAGVRPRRLHHR